MALKKYPNRRLYCTDANHYVSVTEAAPQLLDGAVVTQHKGGTDVTQQVLLALIMEDSRDGHGPSVQALRTLIRDYRRRWQ